MTPRSPDLAIFVVTNRWIEPIALPLAYAHGVKIHKISSIVHCIMSTSARVHENINDKEYLSMKIEPLQYFQL